MDPQVQHDPRTKQQIKDALYLHLYDHVNQAYEKRLQGIILRNCVVMRYAHQSFTYKGQTYSCDQPPYPRKANRLAPELAPDMDAYLAELTQLNRKEIPYVMGFINQVLNASNHFEDYLEVFPESLHAPIRAIIAACPCHNKALTPQAIQALQEQNAASIALVKNRMVINLLV